jgi:hypothetical protein
MSGSTTTENAFAVSNSDNYSASASLSICASVGYRSGIYGDVTGVSVSATTSQCNSASVGVSGARTGTASNSSSATTGTQGQLTASFNAGITLPDTPFRSAPAGALLLVQVDPKSGSVLDVTAVQPGNMAVLIGQNANVYLVDNDESVDANGNPCAFNKQALSVSITLMKPLDQTLSVVSKAMVQALTDLQKTEASLIAQGQILPDDMTSLEAQAKSDLATLLTANNIPQPLPSSESAFFDAWLKAIEAHIERQVQIAYAQYQESLLAIQLAQYAQDMTANLQQNRFEQVMVADLYADMEANQFTNFLNELMPILGQQLFPAAALKNPTWLNGFQTNHGADLASIFNMDWADVSVANATTLYNLLTDFQTEFQTNVATAPSSGSLETVVLAFPNPAYMSVYNASLSTPTPMPAPSWLLADAASSAEMWNAMNGVAGPQGNSTVATITIDPDELYRYLSPTNNFLQCSKTVPIIDQMFLWLGLQSGDGSSVASLFNKNSGGDGKTLGGNLTVPFTVHQTMGFSTAAGLVPYNLTAQTALSGAELNLFAGTEVAAVTAASTAFWAPGSSTEQLGVYTTGQGLSPFMTFDIDLGAVGPIMQKQLAFEVASGEAPPTYPIDLALVMQVETTSVASNLSWEPYCTTTAVEP